MTRLRSIWFGRVLLAFIRRELSALGGYRIAFVIRLLGLGLAVGVDGVPVAFRRRRGEPAPRGLRRQLSRLHGARA